jgi:hypothetical protein
MEIQAGRLRLVAEQKKKISAARIKQDEVEPSVSDKFNTYITMFKMSSLLTQQVILIYLYLHHHLTRFL